MRVEDAGRYYRRALDLSPTSAETMAAMGEWLLTSGRESRARKWLKRARRVDSENPRVLRLEERLAAG